MELLIYICALVFAFLILVSVHELGHFIVARRLGVKVLRFSVGFGPPLFKWQSKSGTDFVLGVIPLGGYISMLDTRNQPDVTPEMEAKAFDKVAPWRQILIAAAGPGANFVLAVLLFWAILLGGVATPVPYIGTVEPDSPADQAGLQPGEQLVSVDGVPVEQWTEVTAQLLRRIGDSGSIVLTTEIGSRNKNYSIAIDNWLSTEKDPMLLSELGFAPGYLPVLEAVRADSAGEKAGLQAGDHIVAISGQPVREWNELVEIVRNSPDQEITVQFERNGNPHLVVATPKGSVQPDGTVIGLLGVERGHPTTLVQPGIFGGLWGGIKQTWDYTTLIITSIGKMITGQMSPSNLAGPVSIAHYAGTTVQSSFVDYVALLGMLSVSPGLINLLPIPVLDGGHIVYATAQMIMRRPVPLKVQQIVTMVGIFFIGGLFILVFFNDITRFIPS